jgi:hypothetical protein
MHGNSLRLYFQWIVSRLLVASTKLDKEFLVPESFFTGGFVTREEMINWFGSTQCYVYCSGKSGSMTLYHTLSQYFRCLHVHNNMNFRAEIAKTDQISIFECIDFSRAKYPRVWLLDSFRMPVERVISSFFQNLEKNLSREELAMEDSLRMPLISRRLDEKINMENYHSINEIMNYFEVPLFQTFNFKKGYNIIQKDNLLFIKLRFNDINRWGSILSEVFGMPVRIRNSNQSIDKAYAGLYLKFKNYYRVPVVAYKELTDWPEFRIYTTDAEKEKYDEKWRNRLKQ